MPNGIQVTRFAPRPSLLADGEVTSTQMHGGGTGFPGVSRRHGYLTGYFLPPSSVTVEVKNLPAMREIWIRFLGWEDPEEEGMATNSSILALRLPMDKGLVSCSP